MNEVEKLRVLIPHWIEHNTEHADEFRSWAEKVDEYDEELFEAAEAIEEANRVLDELLEKLGGALPAPHFHD